ncbi:rod shape-determining protein RodA [Desulforhopalus singaporensis]|uniref:Peptidoglycan glycosyltransferase RodA n=1 Tax=Desulforhopalus singaporensis TaxID=91360 RepID=A0A1H0R743_9BACT|nr:rod shape-determining protein RodA [Desulforhopalus singaporensis]SDP25372.1 cell elongation-specific peptidoglycan biosynthesis regulator RodA [Desulforhopalus singaporensis]
MKMLRIDRRLLEHFDVILLLLIVLVCTMAYFNLYSASFSPKALGTPPYVKQGIFFLMGFASFVFIISFDYQELHSWNYPFYGLIVLMLLLAFFVGDKAGGAQRWINLGFFKLQPSEPAKLMLVITLASYYSRKEINDGYSITDLFVPVLLTAVPFLLILLQPDLGTALMLGIIFVSMTVFVKLRMSTYLIMGSLGMGIGVFAWEKLLKPYQKQRIQTFLNPENDPMGHGYQILQSKIAVGSGGKFGKGYLEGTQGHLHFLPERHTDFAFSVWAEEWGFVGSLIFLGTYFLLLFWGLYVAMNARDRFGVLLAFGVVVLIFWQAIINLFMIMGFLPVVGIPLPLVSYGGSSLLTTVLGLSILMNVRMRRFQPSMSGD